MHPRAAAQGGVSSVRRPFSRTTPPVLRKGIPIHFCRPPPRPRLRRRIPIRFCWQPRPAPCLRRRIPVYLAGIPHPTRACGAPPPPPAGAGSVRGDIRGAAVHGVEPVGYRARFLSGISPCAGPWGYRHGGWGRRGGGTRSPSPVSHTPTILLLAGIPTPLAPHPQR